MECSGTVLTFVTTNKHSNKITEMMLQSYVTIKLAGPMLLLSAVKTIVLFIGNGNALMLVDLNPDKKCAKCTTPGLPDCIFWKCHSLK